MKKCYWLFLVAAALLQGCGDIEWFPESTTTTPNTTTQPTLRAAYNPSTVAAGDNSTLTFTITNSTGNPAQSGLGFTAQLDPLLTLNVPFNQCGGNAVGTSTGRVVFNAGSLSAGTGSCTVTATVSGTTPNSYVLSAANITGLLGGLANGVTNQTLTITAPQVTAPTLTKAYKPAAMQAGGSTTLEFTITNQTGSPAQSGLGFIDTLNANLSVTATSPQCGGTVNASGSQISFTGGQLPLGTGSCTINATVTGTTPGSYTNGATAISGLTGGLVNGVTDQTLTVSASSVSDPTGAVTVSIQNVIPPTDTTGAIITFTGEVNANNNSANNINITVGFIAVDSAGNDILATTQFADADALVPGSNQYTVPLTVDAPDFGNVLFWRILEVTLR